MWWLSEGDGMLSGTLVYVGIGSGLAVGVALLTVAILFLRTARRYVDLAEERLELLRESEALLLKVVRQQGQISEESRQREPERSERILEVVGQPLGQRTGEESSGNVPSPEESDRNVREAPGRREQVSSTEAGERRRERTPKASTPGAAASRPSDGAPLLGVKVPHPDDDVTPRGRNGSVANFFQRKYDLYLEQYERHVRLAERTHRMRDEAGESPGTRQTREWEDKLRRLYDAMDRTTQRLDVLEHHYPELATDGDRLSNRLDLSRLQGELAERFGRPG
jgi:hypothetical protein